MDNSSWSNKRKWYSYTNKTYVWENNKSKSIFFVVVERNQIINIDNEKGKEIKL